MWIDADENREFVNNVETIFGPAAETTIATSSAMDSSTIHRASSIGDDGGWEEEVIAEKSGAAAIGTPTIGAKAEEPLSNSPRTPDDDEMWEEEVISVATVTSPVGGGSAGHTTGSSPPRASLESALPRVRPRWIAGAQAAAEKLVCETARSVLQTSVRRLSFYHTVYPVIVTDTISESESEPSKYHHTGTDDSTKGVAGRSAQGDACLASRTGPCGRVSTGASSCRQRASELGTELTRRFGRASGDGSASAAATLRRQLQGRS